MSVVKRVSADGYATTLKQVRITSEPVNEAATAAEIKTFANISSSTDDTLIGNIEVAARKWVERYLGRTLITTEYTVFLARPWARIDIPFGPVQDVTSATFKDQTTSTTLTIGTDIYVRPDNTAANVGDKYVEINASNISVTTHFPTDDVSGEGLELVYNAGYGDTSSSIPMDIRVGLWALATHFYEHRLDDMPIPSVVYDKLQPYRILDI